MKPTDDDSNSVLIPLNQSAPDYVMLMDAALRSLTLEYPDLWHRSIGPRLFAVVSDSLRFRKETAVPSGLIPWDDGRDLIEAARATLVAGAKAYMEPARHYANRFGQFASRYIDGVLMGQTQPGSYVVTALAPAQALVSLRVPNVATLGLTGFDLVPGRTVTESVARAIGATHSAVEEFRTSQTFEVFDAHVADGASYEMAVALRNLSSGADESEIVVEWDRSLVTSTPIKLPDRFSFDRRHAEVLKRAAIHLAAPTMEEQVTVRGRVHLLAKKDSGGPGVVGVDDGKRKYRVRLSSDEEYHDAVLAHDENRNVEVVGRMSREGTLSWLYGAHLRSLGVDGAEPHDLFGSGQQAMDLDS
jgi:hypothetical protein